MQDGDIARQQRPRVLVWNEGRHEKKSRSIASVYPDGIHGAIAEGLREHGLEAETTTLDDDEQGLSAARLTNVDVLVWWGHVAHGEVSGEAVDRLAQRVRQGMGLIVLHSGQGSKIFGALMGTTGALSGWREDGKPTQVWTVAPGHPITVGVPTHFELPAEEMYAEPFDIPAPDELIFLSSFAGGEAFRSGCCFRRGRGRIFYFQPGHETHPAYYEPMVRRIIANAVRWAAPLTPI